MKIYKLTILEKADNNPFGSTPATNCGPRQGGAFSSLFLQPRERKTEYYISKEKAESKKKKIEETISDLIGLVSAVDIIITEIDVME